MKIWFLKVLDAISICCFLCAKRLDFFSGFCNLDSFVSIFQKFLYYKVRQSESENKRMLEMFLFLEMVWGKAGILNLNPGFPCGWQDSSSNYQYFLLEFALVRNRNKEVFMGVEPGTPI